ncbi:MAG: glutamine--fructose-6-phosphate transaminase (isomerizing) [Firmicutes bacterium]|nr:glutamine--fructose-6-phosphate transaminase (isomerizing) [Bacillota bacterium]
MCGIVGYIGESKAKGLVIDGLKRLEYRGYDSAGIAICIDGKIEIKKEKGKIENLEKIIGDPAFDGNVAIGHTRWATHGVPSATNAHPHRSMSGKIAVVHNGIIENYEEIREELKGSGVKFLSETDTEVIAQLIGSLYDGDLLVAVRKAVARFRGAYAIGVVASDEPDRIVAVRKDAPLIVGLGKDGNFISSDVPAILKQTRDVYFINNDETVLLTKDEVKIFDDDGNPVTHQVQHIDWDVNSAEKGGYDHFMIKEINEQPKGIYDTLHQRLQDDGSIKLDGISLTKEDIENISKIYIVACGTAYHAGIVGKYIIEKIVKIPVEVDIASEFRYRDSFVDEHTLFIAISQSGETLDTLEALREAKRKGARVLSVVNVVGSSVARESDDVFYTWAGPEIAVASTKAYTTQLVCMYLIALYMASHKGNIDKAYYDKIVNGLKEIPDKLSRLLEKQADIGKIAKKYYGWDKIFFVGRGQDVGVSYEGALKLKEISYINAYAIAAGELKHGTIALMDDHTLVIALATQDGLFEKMISNIEEITAREAHVMGLAKESNTKIGKFVEDEIYIPDCIDELTPLLSVVPLQIFAYYVAKERGCDIDKPKNLAKSVTVE